MQRMKVVLAAASLLAMMTAAAAAADVAKGEVLAKRWCAFCHVVAPGQRRGSDVVPTFASIGSRPNFDSKAMAAFIMTPHPGKMPNMSLTHAEADDLAAYIKSQGK